MAPMTHAHAHSGSWQLWQKKRAVSSVVEAQPRCFSSCYVTQIQFSSILSGIKTPQAYVFGETKGTCKESCTRPTEAESQMQELRSVLRGIQQVESCEARAMLFAVFDSTFERFSKRFTSKTAKSGEYGAGEKRS